MENFSRIVHQDTAVTLLGRGSALKADLLSARGFAPDLICADGGLNTALEWGQKPIAVIGDMDSAKLDLIAGTDISIVSSDDQNSTDFEKCLRATVADLVLAVGFLGRRFDHQMAALNALCKFKGRRVILLSKRDLVFLVPSHFKIKLNKGARVSLFPLDQVRATSLGLRWSIDELKMSPIDQIGCSNSASESEVSISVTQGHLIGIIPREYLDALVESFTP